MDPEFWHERWRQNQIGFHQQEINAHLQTFWGLLQVPAGATVFVPLCGKSRDLLWLRAKGHGVLGVELSPIAVRDFFAENGLTPDVTRVGAFERWETDGLVILCGDFFDLGPADLTDVAGVFDRASLIALPPDLRPTYARRLAEILPATSGTLLVTMEYPEGEMQGPPFAVLEGEVRSLYPPGWAVEHLVTLDILAANPSFRQRGVNRLAEKVYRLKPGDQGG